MNTLNMNPFLFITDLDNTLVGNDTALLQLNQKLVNHREQYQSKIVYATGRSLYLYRLLSEAKSLIPPDALITSLGTEMYFDPHHKEFDPEWAEILSQGWNREIIFAIASQFDTLQCQPDSEQNPFKISYYLAQSVADETITELTSTLNKNGYEVKLIYSAGQDLDLLPKNGDKGLVVKFLRRKWNISADQTIVCGNSENDISMFQGEEKGLIVSNAKPELIKWYEANKSNNLLLAQSACAAGIVEGLEHFSLL